MQIVNLKEFVIAVLDVNSEMFVVHVAIWEQKKILVYSEKRAQIYDKVQVGALIFDEIPIAILAKYSDYSDVFSAENATELPKYTGINDHTIKLEKDKQPSFGLIYSLGLVELETLKTYIKINLSNNFIRLSKSLSGALILFDWKLDRSFRFCVDYWSLNNITIKNQYLLFLIGESLN